MAPTIYRPLNSAEHEIRLLELLPIKPGESEDSPLECRLHYCFLSDPLHYEALSYTWGDPTATQPITLNDQPFSITENLKLALQHLRLFTEDKDRNDSSDSSHVIQNDQPRFLWVDALCINQSDTTKRNHQVTLMKQIYERCTRDIAWLGPTVSDLEHHRKEQEAYAEQQREMRENPQSAADPTIYRLPKPQDPETVVQRGMDLLRVIASRDIADGLFEDVKYSPGARQLDGKQEMGVRNVLTYPSIFGRVWVMQELTCAPAVTLRYGRAAAMDWSVISSIVGDQPYADAFHISWGHGATSLGGRDILGDIKAIEDMRRIVRAAGGAEADGTGKERARGKGEGGSSLLDVLARFRYAESTDPRDRIYGLLGLVSEKHNIRVDYNKPAREVFADVTRFFIDSRGDLDALCQSPWRIETIPESPTWAVDVAKQGVVASLAEADNNMSRFLFAQRGIYKAGRPKCAVPIPVEEGNLLRLRGTVLGRLGPLLQLKEEVSTDFYDYTASRRKQLATPRDWMMLYFDGGLLPQEGEKDSATYLNGKQTMLEAYWRTLIMDCEAFPIKRLDAEQIRTDGRDFERLLRHDKPFDEESTKEFGSLVYNLASAGMLRRNIPGWNFTLSQTGLFMMVREGAREGDIIAVLDGGKVPVLLREVESEGRDEKKHVFVNVAYVHGYMDGEAVTEAEEGRLEDQDFLIA